jgi:hypothetical protein
MMYDYLEVFPALKSRGRASAVELKLVLLYLVLQTFRPLDSTELDSCRLIAANTDRICFGTMMYDCLEVFPAFKARGRASSVELVGQTGITNRYCRLIHLLTPLDSWQQATEQEGSRLIPEYIERNTSGAIASVQSRTATLVLILL